MKKSTLIIILSVFAHLLIIDSCLLFFAVLDSFNVIHLLYFNSSWLIITLSLNFYPTARKERFYTNLLKLFYLYIIFALSYFAFFGIYSRTILIPIKHHLSVLCCIYFLLTIYRILFYYYVDAHRKQGGDIVNVVVIGRDRNLKKIRAVFDDNRLGFKYLGYFDPLPSKSPTYLGPVDEAFHYMLDNQVNQIYCIVSRLSELELKKLIHFADNNFKKLKIVPDNKEIFTRAMSIELYDTVPVLNMRTLPLELSYSKLIKRIFDIFFSLLVIVFILSWLTPLLCLIIKLDSPGPIFFKQQRNGVNKSVFWCHKFRTMAESTTANTHMAVKNDVRVTRIGKLLRRTSIDELPQFLDVLQGHMSVVGPRPHMQYHTWEYENSVDKYLVRHWVKPGITGLAQIKGYRGEIITKSDIINRVRLDIFYIEKWSIYFDLRIIYLTVINALRGEINAY